MDKPSLFEHRSVVQPRGLERGAEDRGIEPLAVKLREFSKLLERHAHIFQSGCRETRTLAVELYRLALLIPGITP